MVVSGSVDDASWVCILLKVMVVEMDREADCMWGTLEVVCECVYLGGDADELRPWVPSPMPQLSPADCGSATLALGESCSLL